MSRKPKEPTFDEDNPEWTVETFARAKPPSALPPEVLAAFPKTRGRPVKAEAKVPVSIRLSPEVVGFFKEDGPGWQSRIDETLRRIVKSKRKAG